MSKAVLRRFGDKMTVGDFTVNKPTYDDLMKLNQDLKSALISQLELQSEIKELKKEKEAQRCKLRLQKLEIEQLEHVIGATSVNDMLESAKILMGKPRLTNYNIKK